ncbi:MAG TPA: sensor domain-containing diguanylate cyclase [Acidimicrobiales bacterium]
MAHEARVGTPAAALEVWLRQHPGAVVAAVGSDGTPLPMPPEVPLLGTHVVDDRSFLGLVAVDETARVVTAFTEALKHGVSITTIGMADGRRVSVHYADVRDDYGVMLRLVLPVGEGTAESDLTLADLPSSRPRLAVIEKDDVSTIRAIDSATSVLLGWTTEEMIGHPTLEFIHPDDHARAIDNWMEMIVHGAQHAVRLRLGTKDGGWMWFETSNELCHREDGTRWVLCQMIDISEEMAAADALRYSEQLLRRMAETVPVGLAELGADHTVRYVNESLRTLLSEHKVETFEDLPDTLSVRDRSRLTRSISDAVEHGVDSDVDIRLLGTAAAPDRHCRVALRSLTEGADVLGALVCVMDVTELKAQAEMDALTGLLNKSSITEKLHAALAEPEPVGVIFLDLDRFKPVNDRFGHDVGDQILVRVAEALRGSVRSGDAVGRFGGDEFLVVCPAAADATAVLDVADRLKAATTRVLAPVELGIPSSASIGVAWIAAGAATAAEAIARSDTAMYHAKRNLLTAPMLWDDQLGHTIPSVAG